MLLGLSLVAATPRDTAPLIVYKDNFRGEPKTKPPSVAAWTDDKRGKSPIEVPFKGLYSKLSGAQTTLELRKLPAHEAAVVSFNLVTVGPWIEKGTDFDLHFRISKTGEGHRLLLANPKTNPAPLGHGRKGLLGFAETNVLYPISVPFLHSTDMLLVDFIKGLSPQEDIKFGIHEIEVALFPDFQSARDYSKQLVIKREKAALK